MIRKFGMVLKSVLVNIYFRVSIFLRFVVLSVLMFLFGLLGLIWPNPKEVLNMFLELLERLYNEVFSPDKRV